MYAKKKKNKKTLQTAFISGQHRAQPIRNQSQSTITFRLDNMPSSFQRDS